MLSLYALYITQQSRIVTVGLISNSISHFVLVFNRGSSGGAAAQSAIIHGDRRRLEVARDCDGVVPALA